jgi:hypothetical protein
MGLLHTAAWRPEAIESRELTQGYRAARELQHLDIPAQLGTAIANYILRAGNELERRGIDAARLTADGAA